MIIQKETASSSCKDHSEKDCAVSIVGRTVSTLSDRPDIGEEAIESGEDGSQTSTHLRLLHAIAKSKQSHLDLQNWDKSIGKRSYSKTMSETFASRVLVEQMTKEIHVRRSSTGSNLSSRANSATLR